MEIGGQTPDWDGMQTMRKIRIGPPATGDNFFPRKGLRDRILRSLSRGHLAFLGPRRTGKSSILLDLEGNPPPDRSPIYLDLQSHRDVPSWIALMLMETKKVLQSPSDQLGWLKRMGTNASTAMKRIEQITLLGNGIKLTPGKPAVESWQPMATEFVALLKEHQLPIYFLLDEFPWFLSHVARHHTSEEIEAVLNWFRSARLELVDSPCRFLVTGSIGMAGLLRRHNLSAAANDFDTLTIEPMSTEESIQFLMELAAGEALPISREECSRILERLGVGWPILLATFLSELQELDTDPPRNLDRIDRIYAERMVRGSRNKYCEEMFNRLSKSEVFHERESRLAHEILRQLASVESLSNGDLRSIHARIVSDQALLELHATDVDVVVDTLLHDGYIDRNDAGRYRYSSNILRDYWRHRGA